MKLFDTKRLHYNKYLYKLVIPNQCAGYFRTEFQKDSSLSYTRKKLDIAHTHHDKSKNNISIPYVNQKYTISIPVEHYYDAIMIYRHLKNKEDYMVRCHRGELTIYSNDRTFVVKLSNKLKHPGIQFYEPSPENINLLTSEKNVILVNSQPKYEYKCTLGKKLGTSALIRWIDANPHLAKIGDTARENVLSETWVKGYYFYVRDKKTLLIAQMIIGDNLQRVERLVYPDK